MNDFCGAISFSPKARSGGVASVKSGSVFIRGVGRATANITSVNGNVSVSLCPGPDGNFVRVTLGRTINRTTVAVASLRKGVVRSRRVDTTAGSDVSVRTPGNMCFIRIGAAGKRDVVGFVGRWLALAFSGVLLVRLEACVSSCFTGGLLF